MADHSKSKNTATTEQQYRLQAPKVPVHQNGCLKMLGCGDTKITIYESTTGADEDSIVCCGVSPNRMIINFLHWVFRNSFLNFILLACVTFLAINFLFAFIIYGFGMKDAYCIGGVDFTSDRYVDAFLLSWTTFSTVGYGVIYGGISPAAEDIRNCTGITITLVFEAFCGMLFGSVCGAILFVKVSRVQSFAQVVFSDAVVVRYGSGLQASEEEDTMAQDGDDDVNLEDGKTPCPVLEFRIANKMNSISGGEIIDCAINLVASIDPSQAAGLSKVTTRRRRRGKKGKRGPPKMTPTVKKVEAVKAEDDDDDEDDDAEEAKETLLSKLGLGAKEGPMGTTSKTSGAINKKGDLQRVFAKIEPESFDHPYFKRVWVIRHHVTEESPLLNQYAREMLKRNQGSWPRELNNPAGIRAAIQFDNLVVSFSGTSNADANSVYAQHVYDYGDISVGYSFCNMLYRDVEDDTLFVDMNLINDVMEQNGGGAEPLENAVPATADMKQKIGTLTL